MREQLAALDGQRITVEAVVIRYGTRTVWFDVRVPTICLGPITTPDGAILADHLWFPLGKRLAALNLQPGDRVCLAARVRPYRRGGRLQPDGSTTYGGTDYALVYPSGVTLLAHAPLPAPLATPPAMPAPAGTPTRERVLAALDWLREQAEPMSITRLVTTIGGPPLGACKVLRQYAQRGLVAFTPDGALVVPSSRERSA